MRIRIYPYKQGSRSAAALAAALGGRVLRLEGSRFLQRADDLVINWGSSRFFGQNRFLNGGGVVGAAGNKLTAFQRMKDFDVRIPDFWTNREEIPDDAFPVVCRTVLNAHSGRGIVIAPDRASLVAAPLYVRYVPKQDEFRVHVVNGSAIAVQQKRRRLEHENPNWQVRNHANGFVFARADVAPNPDVLAQSITAVRALGLDFGAADVIWNERRQQAYVLEVNTAPGLEGSTVDDYANAFRRIIDAPRD